MSPSGAENLYVALESWKICAPLVDAPVNSQIIFYYFKTLNSRYFLTDPHKNNSLVSKMFSVSKTDL